MNPLPQQSPQTSTQASAEQALAQLKDIHLPTPAPWWDIAIGWWVLLAVVLTLLVWLLPKCFQWMKNRKRTKFLRLDMMSRLASIQGNYATTKDARLALAEINTLLRQVVITVFENKQKAGLIGESWVTFLDSIWVNKPSTRFAAQPFKILLIQGVYQAPSTTTMEESDMQQLFALVKAWIQQVQKHV